MKKTYLAALCCLAVFLLAGCGNPKELETVHLDRLKSVAVTEYAQGLQRTETFTEDVADWNAGTDYFEIGIRKENCKTVKKEKVPVVSDWVEYRFTPLSGGAFTVRVFTDEKGKTNYLDFENGNTLAFDVPFQRTSLKENGRRMLQKKGFEKLGTRIASGETALSPNYTGADRAWVVDADASGMSEGDNFILPEERRAEYAEDVRWIFTLETERHYSGYAWVQNGQIVGYDHDTYCTMSVTDLLTGERTVLIGEPEPYYRERFRTVCAEWFEGK